jgi:hypothetical protein
MESQDKLITLEDVLEHSALFHMSDVWKLLKKRFKSVLWKREGKSPRKQIYMTHEIQDFKNGLKISGHHYEGEHLILNTDKGTLKFTK